MRYFMRLTFLGSMHEKCKLCYARNLVVVYCCLRTADSPLLSGKTASFTP